MAQIINDIGFAEKFGTGLGEGLESLVQNKLQQIQQQNARRQGALGLQALLGLSPEMAQQAIGAPEAVLREFTKRHMTQGGDQNYLQALNAILGGGQQPEGGTPIISGEGITPDRATKLADLALKERGRKEKQDLAKQKLELAQQANIDKKNAPILKSIEESGSPARRVTKLSDDLLSLLDTGKVITGLAGRFTPAFLQTEEGQQFLSKINKLVLEQAQLGKGVPTRLRLSLEQLSKPDVWQNPKAIRKLLQDIKNDPETQKAISKDIAREQIEEEYGDKHPSNIRSIIEKRAKEIRSQNKQTNQPQTFSELPPASEYPGKIARNPETGQRMRSVNGEWIPVNEVQ